MLKQVGMLFIVAWTLGAAEPSEFEKDCERLARRNGRDQARLHQLFDLHFENLMKENPGWATELGFPGLDDCWGNQSLSAAQRRERELLAPLKVLRSIRRAKLSPADQLNFDLFEFHLSQLSKVSAFDNEFLPINQLHGVHQNLAQVLEMMPRDNPAAFRNILARLKGIPQVLEDTIGVLQAGLARGVTQPGICLRDVPQQILNQAPEDPAKAPVLAIFDSLPISIPEADQQELRREARKVYLEQVRPSFLKFHQFVTGTYLPGCRQTIGLSDLSQGEGWYSALVAYHTTTTLKPSEIHELGLSEVKRIRGEMSRVMKSTGFAGDLPAFFEYLRTNSQFYFSSKEDLLTAYRNIAKRADPELPKFFGKLPRLPYGVRPVPEFSEKSQTTAYYQPGSARSGRPAWFMANTYALNTRPRWEMEALTLHEAVPGHHLQIALAQELENVPAFRTTGAGYTAFIEGWALYAESLGSEMGFYQDPYSRFGQLTYEMWRAIRLVADTGIHSMGWSRQQAIDVFSSNTGKPLHDITVEVDRYIVWPGQALAYKVGELKIKELKSTAARELGDRFDIRQFHDQLLEDGPLPLDILERKIQSWIAVQSGAKKS